MSFHLGKPILVMIVLAIVSGAIATLTRDADTRADLELWCFSEQNWKVITRPQGGAPESLQARFERQAGYRRR